MDKLKTLEDSVGLILQQLKKLEKSNEAPTGSISTAPLANISEAPTGSASKAPLAVVSAAPLANISEAPTGSASKAPLAVVLGSGFSILIQFYSTPCSYFRSTIGISVSNTFFSCNSILGEFPFISLPAPRPIITEGLLPVVPIWGR
ncbi:uncharacterized protein LOC124817659 isoform X2 [Hydra vulgaris]|uniref:uncharacterized protein LOC124817659 isoform X2 n=1 Tax=Hydra vulgaris TaxID=6087 RepID=UPI0032EA8418